MSLVSLGPLTLECICDGGAGVPCAISALDLIVTGWFNDSMQDFEAWVINGGTSIHINGNAVSGMTIASWLPNLSSLTVRLRLGRALSSDYLATAGAKFRIRATFVCTDGGSPVTKYVYSYFNGSNTVICPDNGQGAILGSSIAGQWWHSRPLSSCTVIDFTVAGGFTPILANQVQGGTSGTSAWCLCASGGTGDYDAGTGVTAGAVYKFAVISGALPSGQYLDEDTGCILGVPDGADPGTSEVTFRVLDTRDPNGGYADVTCGLILPGCTGATVQPAGNWFI